jgi:tetratricopeptide (TPR) repeat protein
MSFKLSRLDPWIILLIFALGFACYGNTLNGPFLLDDVENIVLNVHIRLHNLSPTALADAAFGSLMPSRPVANISFALNYLIHGYWLPGYHLTNIIIHCLTGVLLFFFIKGTFTTPALRQLVQPEKARQVAAISTLLWLLNPLDTQSVSYIVQRMNSLAAMFFLLSMLLYLQARTSAKHRPGYFSSCLISGLLALGSKEIAVMLPPIIFLYEWYFLQNLDRRWLKRKLPLLGVAAVAIVVLAWLYLGRNFSAIVNGYQSRDFTLWQRLMTEPRVVCRYLFLIFLPYPGLLNLDHDYQLSTALLHPPSTILAITALATLILAAVLSARRHRLLSFGILWFFLNLLIESTIIPLEIIFDHRTYLPSMLVWPPLLTIAFQLPGRKRMALMTGAIMLLVIFATWTFQRNQLWADEVAINQDIVLKSPNKARAHTSLGKALIFASRGEEGVRELKYAIKLDPNYAFSYINLGGYYLVKHNYDEAIANLLIATRMMPSYRKAYYTLSTAYFENKQYAEAITAARVAVTVPDVQENALLTLGLASSETGDLETTISSFRELSRNYPSNGRYRFNLGRALEKNGQKELALQKYQEALEIAADTDKKVIQQAINELRKDLHYGG